MAEKKSARGKKKSPVRTGEKAIGKKSSDEKREEKREETIEKINENIEKAKEKDEKAEDAHPNKKQAFEENKTLVIVLSILFLFVAAFVVYMLVSNNAKSFTYNGVKYTIIQQGQITFYNTQIPVVEQGKNLQYNFYIRNDPRTLNETVPFNGSLYIRPAMNLNYSNDIACNGYGTIAVENLVDLYTVLGTKVVRDANATCDPQKKYVDVNIKVSNKTDVEEVAPACYVINVANCQILQATERYMIETFSTIKPYLNSS